MSNYYLDKKEEIFKYLKQEQEKSLLDEALNFKLLMKIFNISFRLAKLIVKEYQEQENIIYNEESEEYIFNSINELTEQEIFNFLEKEIEKKDINDILTISHLTNTFKISNFLALKIINNYCQKHNLKINLYQSLKENNYQNLKDNYKDKYKKKKNRKNKKNKKK